MGTSGIYTWTLLGCGLGVLYFLACKLTKERVRKWSAKGIENQGELQILRMQTILTPPFVALAASLALLMVFVTSETLCQELPNRITGSWPICEGTIVGWYDGYRGGKGSAKIQVGDTAKGYNIRNRNIREGEMVGVTVRMALNGDNACILEYKEGDNWVREMTLPNFGREKNAVPKTIALNLLAACFACGLLLKKLLRPEKTALLQNRAVRSGLGSCLIALTLAGQGILWAALLHFEKSWQGEAWMVNSQRFALAMLCADVLFAILITPKSTGYRYWWVCAKEFLRELEAQEKR